MTQTCESCGREFGCGARDGSCWCGQVALGPERLAILREHFEKCLCPDCLTVAAGEAPNRSRSGHRQLPVRIEPEDRRCPAARCDGRATYRDPAGADHNRPYRRSGR